MWEGRGQPQRPEPEFEPRAAFLSTSPIRKSRPGKDRPAELRPGPAPAPDCPSYHGVQHLGIVRLRFPSAPLASSQPATLHVHSNRPARLRAGPGTFRPAPDHASTRISLSRPPAGPRGLSELLLPFSRIHQAHQQFWPSGWRGKGLSGRLSVHTHQQSRPATWPAGPRQRGSRRGRVRQDAGV